ncbi:sulfite exporter TauE/SafE family protein [Arcobacteraceae bacterium]|nr:sulfite exporter TauE/SafE family protein [Arcobacteraceae bacterium]
MEAIDFISIATIAFLGSFGHCVGMCGGIVIAYSSTKVQQGWSKTQQSLSHLLYSLGRILTYSFLGAIFGYLGSVATFSNTANGILWLIAGTAMLLTGLSLLGKVKFLALIEHSFSKSTWYQNNFRALLRSQTFTSFFLLGMLNGLLPCGFVYFFAITAASTADPLYGALVMIIFGISTVPALFSLGFFVGLFKQSGLRNIMMKLAAISVILYGSYTIYNGYDYMNTPNKTLLQSH